MLLKQGLPSLATLSGRAPGDPLISLSGNPAKVTQKELQDYELLLATLLPECARASVAMRLNDFEDALVVLNNESAGTLAGDVVH